MVFKYKNDNEYELYCMLINTILWRLNELVAGPTRHMTSSSQTAVTRQAIGLYISTNDMKFSSLLAKHYTLFFIFQFKLMNKSF